MVFILLGVLLLVMKLGGIHPVAQWEWFSIAIPFVLAICWFEVIEPWFGLDVRRQQLRKRQLEARIRYHSNKKPQRSSRGFPFR